MRFRVNLTAEPEGGYTVTFPEIPEAITCGATIKDALTHAKDALESAMDFYLEAQRQVPLPSRVKKGRHYVEIAPSLAAKILLLNEMIAQKIRPVELARRMKISPQDVNRLTNTRHATKIDNIAVAMHSLGKTLEMRAI